MNHRRSPGGGGNGGGASRWGAEQSALKRVRYGDYSMLGTGRG